MVLTFFFQKLPSKIGKLSKLRVLDLENNQLESLPQEIGLLSELQELNLASNCLSTLPKAIKSVYATHDQLSLITVSLFKSFLYFHFNYRCTILFTKEISFLFAAFFPT